MTNRLTVALTCGVLAGPAAAATDLQANAASTPLDVPAGRAPTLDGNVEADEWSDALVVVSAPSGAPDAVELLAKHDGQTLYLAVRRQRSQVTTLGIAQPKGVAILHTSASLGMAEYHAADTTWNRIADFQWRCSDLTDATKRANERKTYLAEHGWIATTAGMGRGETEMAIGAQFMSGGETEPKTLRVALALLGNAEVRVPRDLRDGMTGAQLQMGYAPQEVRFAPDDWSVVRLATGGAPSAIPTTTTTKPKFRRLEGEQRPRVASLAEFACFDVAGTWLFVDSETAIEPLAADVDAAAAAFETHFARRPRRGAVIVGSGSMPPSADQELRRAGARWTLPWVSADALALAQNPLRKQIEEQLRAQLEPLGVGAAEIESQIERVLAQLAGATASGGAGVLRHELGHMWFIDTFWPRRFESAPDASPPDPSTRYAGPAADWLDETAAILLENEELAARRRAAFRETLTQRPSEITPLPEFFVKAHPHVAGAPAGARAANDVEFRVDARIDVAGESTAGDELFYAQARSLADFLLLRGHERVFASIATHAGTGGSMAGWLLEHGAAHGLPTTTDDLQTAWMLWCRE